MQYDADSKRMEANKESPAEAIIPRLIYRNCCYKWVQGMSFNSKNKGMFFAAVSA